MAKTQGKVHSIISNLVLVKVEGPVSQNEQPRRADRRMRFVS